MLAFLLLSDGPIDVDTLKPFRDEQWWARRDSLCRISSLGLWSSPRTAELSFLFAPTKCDNKNDESNHSGLYSALSMRRSEKSSQHEIEQKEAKYQDEYAKLKAEFDATMGTLEEIE